MPDEQVPTAARASTKSDLVEEGEGRDGDMSHDGWPGQLVVQVRRTRGRCMSCIIKLHHATSGVEPLVAAQRRQQIFRAAPRKTLVRGRTFFPLS